MSDYELDWKGRTPPQKRGAEEPGAAGRGVPGDPKNMSTELRYQLEPLFNESSIEVRQIKEWGEILTGWETRNRYEVRGSQAGFFLYVGETGRGLGELLLRNFWPFRSINIEFMTNNGTMALSAVRPFTWFFSRLEV